MPCTNGAGSAGPWNACLLPPTSPAHATWPTLCPTWPNLSAPYLRAPLLGSTPGSPFSLLLLVRGLISHRRVLTSPQAASTRGYSPAGLLCPSPARLLFSCSIILSRPLVTLLRPADRTVSSNTARPRTLHTFPQSRDDGALQPFAPIFQTHRIAQITRHCRADDCRQAKVAASFVRVDTVVNP